LLDVPLLRLHDCIYTRAALRDVGEFSAPQN